MALGAPHASVNELSARHSLCFYLNLLSRRLSTAERLRQRDGATTRRRASVTERHALSASSPTLSDGASMRLVQNESPALAHRPTPDSELQRRVQAIVTIVKHEGEVAPNLMPDGFSASKGRLMRLRNCVVAGHTTGSSQRKISTIADFAALRSSQYIEVCIELMRSV